MISRRLTGASPSTQKRLPSSDICGKTKRVVSVAIVSDMAPRFSVEIRNSHIVLE